jgi:hypothetical protein
MATSFSSPFSFSSYLNPLSNLVLYFSSSTNLHPDGVHHFPQQQRSNVTIQKPLDTPVTLHQKVSALSQCLQCSLGICFQKHPEKRLHEKFSASFD